MTLAEGRTMDRAARMTSKGQVTVPKAVREALGLEAGDQLIFRVEGDHAIVARTPNFLELAGTIAVPDELRGASWDEIRTEARRARAAQRH